MAHSVVEIPVPEVDSVVRARLERRSPEQIPVDPREPVAHIALFGPLSDPGQPSPGAIAELERLFADVTPFDFQLAGLHRSLGSPEYVDLSPTPVRPFRRLTHALAQRFPEQPPYAAASTPRDSLESMDLLMPRLSVPLLAGETVEALEAELVERAVRLPISCVAREARLFSWEPGNAHTIAVFPFGTSAA